MLYWIAKVLAKASKGESDIRPGKDACVHQASNTLLVLFGIGAFVIWSSRAETAIAVNRKLSRLVLVILYFHALENHLKVGGLVHSNHPLGSVPYNLYAKDLFHLPQVLDLEESLEG